MKILKMDRRKFNLLSTASYLLLLLSLSLGGATRSDVAPDDDQSVSSLHYINKNLAYFNTSHHTHITVPSTISLRDLISFSFRTCSHGSLIQAGSTEDFLRIDLTPEGHLKVSWQDENYSGEEVTRRTHTILVGDKTSDPLNSNQWYTIDVRFNLGEIFLTVEQGSRLLHRILMSNSSYHEYLQNLELDSSEFVKIGENYTGCFSGGPNLLLNQAGMDFSAGPVEIGKCPLEDSIGCGAEDPCWKYPCSNGGMCKRRDDTDRGYTCECPVPYTGNDCEVDLGDVSCELTPCMHEAECVTTESLNRKYYCKCPPGYTGVQCEVDIDECMPRPCQNGGQCTDLVNAYECNCTGTGFEGNQCEINIDECTRDAPCDGGATCTDTPGSYKCQCPFGFGGKVCDDAMNECLSNPCRHGAECLDHLGMFECVCQPGYTGTQCEVDIDDCIVVTCNGTNAECIDGINAYSCQCKPGYHSNLEDGECHDIDECAENPCQHGATCFDFVGSYECACAKGYTGLDCELDIDDCKGDFCENGARCVNCERVERSVDDCDLEPCQHGATCIADEPTGYTCHCTDDYMGRNCTEVYNACALLPCHNGGNCSTTPPSHYKVCQCPAGFTGQSCETNIDDCVDVMCTPPMQCMDQVDSYKCDCPVGYEGEACNVPNDCVSSPCKNGGSCIAEGDSYRCECVGMWINHTSFTGDNKRVYWVGYEGTNCEQDVSECEFSTPICLNGGLCKPKNDTEYGFQCYCPNGGGDYFTGIYCQDKLPYCTILNERDPPVCHNDGRCEDVGDNDFRCYCEPGFTGRRCETNIFDCDPNPCQNNATCVDGINEYICACLEGYTGVNCSVDIDECDSNPCQHGSQCLDIVNGYMCNCNGTGFMGTNCEYEIDECQSDPCLHQGNCNNRIMGPGSDVGYICSCHPGYSGFNCEIDVDECLSEPCQNNGTCFEKSDESLPNFNIRYADGYTCECLTGFTGSHCEVNINECEDHTCVYGHCVDAINDYVCACDDGYRGKNCDIEVDECAVFTPCQNGAACIDKIADYTCTCFMNKTMDYGGKNCSVLLTGCVENMCQNGAPCLPSLMSEEPAVLHSYSCNCPFGHSGMQCQKNTTASFFGDSWLRVAETDNMADMDMSLRFQTTLPDALLMVNIKTADGKTDYVLLQLIGGSTLNLSYVNQIQEPIIVLLKPGVSIADGNWYELNVTIRYTEIKIQLFHPSCPNSNCTASKPFPSDDANVQHHTLGETWFGGDELQLDFVQGVTMFTGCMQDIKVAGTAIIPDDYVGNSSTSKNVVVGCARVEQCGEQTCSSHGNCTDLWVEYNCSCWRPYLGQNCDEDYKVGTFGHEETTSQANFSLPEDDELKQRNDISFFFRTRQENGLLFYLGATDGSTYLATDLSAGQLRVRLNLGEGEKLCDQYTDYVTNGNQYYFRVIRDGAKITFWVQQTGDGDPTVVDENDANHCTLQRFDAYLSPQVFYVGGFPPTPSSSRRRRDILTSSESFKGTIQDIRQNDWLAQFFPLNNTNATGQPLSYPEPQMFNVLEGKKTDDMCLRYTPCVNNATCSNVFLNDYLCTCTEGFRGKNCSELDFCVSNQCPGNSTCLNLDDGYECVSSATFDGLTSYLQYSNSLNVSVDIKTIFIEFRTRKEGTTLLHVKGKEIYSDNFITFEIIDNLVVVTFDLGEANELRSTLNITDGEWHNASLTIESGGAILKIDNFDQTAVNNITNDVTLFDLVESATDVFVGGVLPTYRVEQPNMIQTNLNFKGCLEEVRIGSILLPFFDQSELTNNTSKEQFFTTTIQDIAIDCTGDPVCDTNVCENNSTCVDIWNDYECDCLVGYAGDYCEIDIDECIDHECQNNATCVDGIANYTCTCMDGYTGYRCEIEIDECDSSPCWNNGTCIDLIAEYECNCTTNFTGDNCQIDINENCDYNPDLCNNGTCITVNTTIEGVTTFNCSCEPGITGRYCESEIDYCEGEPCLNNATCLSERAFLNYTCTCADGFTGINCETEIDECLPNPCQNNGTCTDFIARYECRCQDGWEGVDCDLDINECNSTESNNSTLCNYGQCINHPGNYECNCTGSGYEGPECAEDINECLDETTCQNNATCENFNGSFTCNCTFGYEGDNCESANCSMGNCFNDGICLINDEEWSCECPPFVEGFRCEAPGPCVEEPCENNATCSQTGDEYTCACERGWEGRNCTEDIDECVRFAPCQNNATCFNEDGSYTCTCVPGFTDFNCSTDIDECEVAPCENNGQCIDKINSYECDCLGTGYTGTECQTDVDECEESPCQNEGTCLNLPGSFNCTCTEDYVGLTCHSTNPCVEEYCQNGATCRYEIDDGAENATALCMCDEPWYGPQCEFTNDPGVNIPLIVGLTVGFVLAAIIVALIVMLVVFKEKRATRGTYSPSRQETVGSRVELGNVLKQPPMERLI